MAGSTKENLKTVIPSEPLEDQNQRLPISNEMSKSRESFPMIANWMPLLAKESIMTSKSTSTTTSAETTPNLEFNEKLPNFYALYSSSNIEKQGTIYNKDLQKHFQFQNNNDNIELDESDDTVIYFGDKKNNLEEENFTKFMEGNTKRCLSIDDILDEYIYTVKQSEFDLINEVHLMFEEFKFDIITDHLSLPMESFITRRTNNSNFDIELNDKKTQYLDESINGIGENMVINLSETPYLLLLHSISPKLMSFSILSFLRRNILNINRTNVLSLLILSISILNMTGNSSRGLKLYSRMLIFRTKKLLILLPKLEKYLIKSVKNKSNRQNNIYYNSNFQNKKTKLNLISSSIHLLISVFVKRIGKLISYVSNIGSLWKYIAVYALDNDFEEIKVIRNIIENPVSCSCTWVNDPLRLISSLQYVRKLLLCIIMSSMEIKENEKTEMIDNEKSIIFMKNFWSKFGFENIKWNINNLTFATRVLGMSTCLEELNIFIENLENEIIDEDIYINVENNVDNECYDFLSKSDKNYLLDIVNEKNEDERIRNLNSIVSRIGYKLDLIELGVDNNDNIIKLKDDMNDLIKKYNELTSGKCSNTQDSIINDMSLKKMRMSQILFEEFDDNKEEIIKNKRRSSGINIKLFTVVKDKKEEEDKKEQEEKKEEEEEQRTQEVNSLNDKDDKQEVILDQGIVSDDIRINNKDDKDKNEFKKTLEKLHSRNLNSQRKDRITNRSNINSKFGKENECVSSKIDENAFIEFKKELKQRLELERL